MSWLNFLGYMPRSVSLDCVIGLFLVFQGTSILLYIMAAINLHPYQQWIIVPFCLYPHQHLLFFVLLMVAILTEVR
jgi:hypothetical protein